MAKRKTVKKVEKEGRFYSFMVLTVTIFFFCSLLFPVSSYSKTEEPGKQPSKKNVVDKTTGQKAAAKAKKPVKEKPAVSEEYSYDATGKPDPFLPLIAEASPRKRTVASQKTKPLTPLQKYDLNELNLVAIISAGEKASALLEDSARFGYIVKDGMLIGKNDGVIKKITENGIIIEEKIYNSMGNLETKISTLTIQHQE